MNELFKNKHILVDTCIISSIFHYPDKFISFLESLDSLSITLAINPFIYLEFLRIAKNINKKKEIENFFEKKFFNLKLTPDVIEITNKLYPLYNFCNLVRNNSQISIVDAFNVAYLAKYKDNLLFLTADHKDYPQEIVDRIEIGAVDIKNDIITWGIYKFSEENFETLLKKYEKL